MNPSSIHTMEVYAESEPSREVLDYMNKYYELPFNFFFGSFEFIQGQKDAEEKCRRCLKIFNKESLTFPGNGSNASMVFSYIIEPLKSIGATLPQYCDAIAESFLLCSNISLDPSFQLTDDNYNLIKNGAESIYYAMRSDAEDMIRYDILLFLHQNFKTNVVFPEFGQFREDVGQIREDVGQIIEDVGQICESLEEVKKMFKR